MKVKFMRYSLQEKFGIEVLDFPTRDNAGLIVADKIYINESHNGATKAYCKEHSHNLNLLQDKHSYLHFIKDNVFIDMNKILTNMDINQVINIIKRDLPGYTIWKYYYKKYIELVK